MYRLLTYLLAPVFLFYTLRISFRDRSWRYCLQRLGFSYSLSINNIAAEQYNKQQQPIWIHCASVGEINTYVLLHKQLVQQYPQHQFLITTNTTTGASNLLSAIKRDATPRTLHSFLPIENNVCIAAFLNFWQPQRCLIMETEIWPLLYSHCQQRHIQIDILNARLSHRTLNGPGWIKKYYQQSLQSVKQILCKSEQERQHFLQLGANASQLVIAGNLKFAHQDINTTDTDSRLIDRAYCLAASTHHNEEQLLADLWLQINTDRLLVIAPRHPNRSAQIQKQLRQLNVRYAVRSKQQIIEDDCQIYLADTLGELNRLMRDADFVYIGGSMIKHGGQNILEAARLGKASLCGPHMYNFKDEVDLLNQADGCIQVKNSHELKQMLIQLLTEADTCERIGQNAKRALQQKSEVLETYLSLLKPL